MSENKGDDKDTENRRKHPRFSPGVDVMARIDTHTGRNTFVPEHFGLIVDESSSGCRLVVRPSDELVAGKRIVVQLGGQDPLIARIVWQKEVDHEARKLGIEIVHEDRG